jgi:type II secretory ATPase GspE/PulE/Tfp pilus assembly ATPase PilB-like protein
MNMNIEPFLLSSSITGVLGVRLIRKNCRYCAQPYEPEPHMMKNVPMAERESAQFRRGAGCDQCLNTGFSGRTAVTELLKADHIFRAAVMDKVPTRVLQDVAISQGMQTMWQRGLRRALSGETTLEEIQRVISVDEI